MRFDHDAHPIMSVADAGPEIFGPGQVRTISVISAPTPNPGGMASIGDDVEAEADPGRVGSIGIGSS